jgi:1-acyl-sn-glycerol-3-phosphate acyltransferase
MLWVTGWTQVGARPPHDKYVLIAAPHTSNWDLVFLLAFAWSFDLPLAWMGKHTIFPPSVGGVMRALGGVPVRRDRRNNMVQQMVELFEQRSELALTVPAEGTRDRGEYWKSGFYRIAVGAGVPIVPGFLDYSRRRGGFGAAVTATGDVSRDMDLLRSFYADKVGRYPHLWTPPLLREEAE